MPVMQNIELPQRSLHIAMVVRSFSTKGGLELYTYQVVRGLLERGIRVTVICEENSSALSHSALKVVCFEAAPKTAKWRRIKHYFNVASKAVAEHGPFDLVHSQHLPIANADIVTFHDHTTVRLQKVGFGWERLLNKVKLKLVPAYQIRHKLDELLCRSAKCLIFPARIMKDDYWSVYGGHGEMDRTSYVVAHPGSSLAKEDTVSRAGRLDSPFTFLFVGRGFRKKGLDVLTSACKILADQKRQFKLLIAGLREKPLDKMRLSLLGLTKFVQYLGFRNDMQEVFAQAQVFVMPSRLEPFGMAPLQAMKSGLVPIISRVSGVSEVLHGNEDSLILEDHLCASELAMHMSRLMDDRELLERLSNQAIGAASAITWSDTVQSTIDAYDIALKPNLAGSQSFA